MCELYKVEKILKGSLEYDPITITFTFIENSNYGRESSLEVQNIAGRCQQTFRFQKFVDITHQCFVVLPQVKIPATNLNFH